MAVADIIAKSSADLCSATAMGCSIKIGVNIGQPRAYSSDRQIFITTSAIRFLRSDDELAAVLGHEWAHILLRHEAQRGRMDPETAEVQADCVGAALATRAGYQPAAAVRALKRFMATPSNAIADFIGFGDASWPRRAENLDRAVADFDSRRNRRQFIDRAAIRAVCGVAP